MAWLPCMMNLDDRCGTSHAYCTCTGSAATLLAACSDPKGVDDACKRLLKEKACTYYRCVDNGVSRGGVGRFSYLPRLTAEFGRNGHSEGYTRRGPSRYDVSILFGSNGRKIVFHLQKLYPTLSRRSVRRWARPKPPCRNRNSLNSWVYEISQL